MAESEHDLDRYQRQTPYEILGIMPDATMAEARDRHTLMDREINDTIADAGARGKEQHRIGEAYNKIRTAKERLRVDFFLLDGKLFLRRCESIAKTLTKPKTDVEGVIKPRKIRVNHAALLSDLKEFQREPEKITGFQPRAMEVPEPMPLPAALAVQFDC